MPFTSSTYSINTLGSAFFSSGSAIADAQFEIGDPSSTLGSLIFGDSTSYTVMNPGDIYSIDIRNNDTPRLGAHGSVPGYDLYNERQIVFNVMVKGTSVQDLQSKIETWKKFWQPQQTTVLPLRWKMKGVTNRYLVFGRPRRVSVDVSRMGARYATLTQEFVCPDPRIYEDVANEVTGTLTDPVSYIVNPNTNDSTQPWTTTGTSALSALKNTPVALSWAAGGTIDSPLFFNFLGPLKNPKIIDNNIGTTLSFTFDIGSGDEVLVDSDGRAVVKNAADSFRYTLAVLGNTIWPASRLAGNSFGYTADRADLQSPSLRVWYRNAFI